MRYGLAAIAIVATMTLARTGYGDEGRQAMPEAEAAAAAEAKESEALQGAVRQARTRFVDTIEPHRPALHRYCRTLTGGSIWEAEDLVQEALLRAFARLAEVHEPVRDVRAYLFRIATNVWIDEQRRRGLLPRAADVDAVPEPAAEPEQAGPEVREALLRLARRLPPRERAAVLLKDVFDFDLDETADFIGTTRGAVKAALHRARGKLAEPVREEVIVRAGAGAASGGGSGPAAALVDAWVAAFNARDVDRLVGLMLPGGRAEIVGVLQEYGRDATRRSLGHTVGEEGLLRAERREHEGEAVVLLWYRVVEGDGTPRDVVRDVIRIEGEGGAVARFRYYFFCHETLREVGAALGVPDRDNGYRY